MQAKSPSSFLASLILHGFVAALIFVTTIYVAQRAKEVPVVFELVAGPPTAPNELVAPAKGNSATAPKLDVPKVVLPPEPPVQQTVKTEPTPAKDDIVTPPKPKNEKSILQEMKQKQKVSYKEYLKAHPTPKPQPAAPQKAANVPRIDTKGIVGGVAGGSTANTKGGGGGKALTREEQSELNTYISFLLNALKEAHEPPPGVSDKLEARVTFDITAGGFIRNPRISKSSGDRAFDDSVIEAFRRVPPIGPTPNGKPDTWTVTFRMKDEN
ncbi:MAG: TonB family protein [Lacunisphaera sp.]|nr:TonB family protein [Lacunisphaera sp.]